MPISLPMTLSNRSSLSASLTASGPAPTPSGFGFRSAVTRPPVAVDHQLGELGDEVALDGHVVADVGERLGRRVEGEDARRPLPFAQRVFGKLSRARSPSSRLRSRIRSACGGHAPAMRSSSSSPGSVRVRG